MTISSKCFLPVPLVFFACFPSTKRPSVSLEKKKRCIFPLMKGFCPRTISYPGTTNQSCLCWALGPYVNSASVPSFSLWLEQHQMHAFAKYSYNPGSLACLATPLQALREDGVMPQGKQPPLLLPLHERRNSCRNSRRHNVYSIFAAKFL